MPSHWVMDNPAVRTSGFSVARDTMHHEFEPKSRRQTPTWAWVALVVEGVLVVALAVALAVVVIQNDAGVLQVASPFAAPMVASSTNGDPEVQGAMTFDEVFDGNFTPRAFYGAWLSTTNMLVYKKDNGGIYKIDAANKEEAVFLSKSFIDEHKVSDYYVSPDQHYALLACDKESIWRHSYYANYKIYVFADEEVKAFPNFPDLDTKKLRYAKWMAHGLGLIFIYGNNLYYQEDPTATATQLTFDGDEIYYFNAIPDWLYEEDVLASRTASYSNPNGQYLAYGTFNDTHLHFVRYSLYGKPDAAYGTLRELAYPICGDITEDDQPGPNSRAELWVQDVTNTTLERKKLEPPEELTDQDHYFTRVSWRDDTHVLVTWSNRVQNISYVIMYDVTDMTSTLNLKLESRTGWIESPFTKPRWVDADSYLTILPKTEGDSGEWKHLARVTTPTNAEGNVTFLTSGQEVVLNVVAYDNSQHLVYYLTTAGDQRDRHLYRIGLPEADEALRERKCMSCEVDDCEYVSAYFSASTEYYVLNCLGPAVPTYSIRNTKGETVQSLEDNKEFAERIVKKNIPPRKFDQITIPGGYNAWTEVYPRPEGSKPGPLLIYTYGGPSSQMVTKRYHIGGRQRNWMTYLMTTHGIVIASLDGRGTGAGGDKLMHEIYRSMGTVEVDDQIKAGSHFGVKDYVDKQKDIAIFGWSYGGQLTSHVIGQESKDIKCGVAVAPVTTQRLYDTAYTERYMGLATSWDNQAGYNKTDVMPMIENYRNKKYFLAHGTDDDNVHFRHAALLIRALSDAEIPFRTHVFVDENHGIGALHQSRHLYREMTDFLLRDCWQVQDDVNSASPPTVRCCYPTVLSVLISLIFILNGKLCIH